MLVFATLLPQRWLLAAGALLLRHRCDMGISTFRACSA